MKRALIFLTVMMITLFAGASRASALTGIPFEWPYRIEIDGGAKFLQMTPEYFDDVDILRAGLYYNTNPPENIYYTDVTSLGANHSWELWIPAEPSESDWPFTPGTVPMYSRSDVDTVIISNNGAYFAYIADVWLFYDWYRYMLSFDKLTAITIYNNGDIIKSYLLSDLVSEERETEFDDSTGEYIRVSSSWGWGWERKELRRFDEKTNTLTITTLEDVTYTFDLITGEITDVRTYVYTELDNVETGDSGSIALYVMAMILSIVLIILSRKGRPCESTYTPTSRGSAA